MQQAFQELTNLQIGLHSCDEQSPVLPDSLLGGGFRNWTCNLAGAGFETGVAVRALNIKALSLSFLCLEYASFPELSILLLSASYLVHLSYIPIGFYFI